MLSWLSKLWESIKKAFKKIWDVLKIVLVIALICLALYIGFFGITILGVTFSGWGWAAFVLGVTAALFPDTLREIVDRIVSVATDIATGVGQVVGEVVSTAGSAILGSPIGLVLMVGLGLWLFSAMGGGKGDSSRVVVAPASREEEDGTVKTRAAAAQPT